MSHVQMIFTGAVLGVAGALSGGEQLAPAEPGARFRLEASFQDEGVSLKSYVHPRVRAYDADGKVIFSKSVGTFFQRTYSLHDLSEQNWCLYAQVDSREEEAASSKRAQVAVPLVQLPVNTAKIGLSLIAEGEPTEWQGEKLSIVRRDQEPPRVKRPFIEVPAMNPRPTAEVAARLAARKPAHIGIQRRNGRITTTINGIPDSVRIYKIASSGMRKPDIARLPAFFSRHGFNVIAVPIALSDLVDAEGRSKTIELFRQFLAYEPELNLFINLDIRPSAAWLQENPSEIMRNEKGQFAVFHGCRTVAFSDTPTFDAKAGKYPALSYFSVRFRHWGEAVLKAFLEELAQIPEGKAIAGLYLNGGADGQWFDSFDQRAESGLSADYADCAQDYYRDYLKRKYGTPEKLGAAWGRSEPVAFESVKIPGRSDFWTTNACYRAHGASPESDCREATAAALAELQLGFAHVVKAVSGGRLLAGGYGSNGGLSGYPKIALSNDRFLLASEDFDFAAVVPSYVREHVDPVMAPIWNGSFAHRGKLYVAECDLRCAEGVRTWGYWGTDFWLANNDISSFRRTVLKHVAEATVRGGGYHAYDMDGGWYSSPGAIAAWVEAERVARAASPLPIGDDSILVTGGENYFCHQSFGDQLGRMVSYALRDNPRRALAYAGVPNEFRLLDELMADPAATFPKVTVFNDLTTVSLAEFRRLRAAALRPGRVVVYMYRLGLFAPDGAEIERELDLKPAASDGRVAEPVEGADPLLADISGALYTSYMPWKVPLIHALEPDGEDSGWKTIAKFREPPKQPAAFVRRFNGATEVYLAQPLVLTPQFCRNLLREAGGEPIIETDDLNGFGSGLFYIVALKDGVKHFTLPAGMCPLETIVGPKPTAYGDGYAVTLKRGDVFILSVINR